LARISVVTLPPLDDITWKYEVEVTESDGSGSQTTHQVTMDKGYYMDLTERGRTIPEEFVRKSFEFILDRESKDSILRQFDISQINDFFPEYEKEIKKVLDRS
jgi:hypothetical protein